MEQTTRTSPERQAIFGLFIYERALRFSQIEKLLQMRSNLLSYHLEKMIEAKLLEKHGEEYRLTLEGEKLLPTLTQTLKKEQGPLCVVTAGILRNGKVCLLRRKKRPYQGYWGVIGGKLRLGESIEETAIREALEETGLTCRFKGLRAVIHERVEEDGNMKHAFVLFFCELETSETSLRSSEEGDVAWFAKDALPENIIPSDVLMLERLEGPFMCMNVVLHEKDGCIIRMDRGTL